MKYSMIALIFVLMTSLVTEAQITGEVRNGKLVIIASEPTEIAGFDLISAASLLEPVPDETGAAPFTFFLANTENQITWGILGAGVTLDGEWITEAGYTGLDPENDLVSNWGSGGEPVSFPVRVVPEPSSGLILSLGCIGLMLSRRRRSQPDCREFD